MSERKVIVTDDSSGKKLELPVIVGTEGEPTLEIKSLPSELGYFTYDPGFSATAACTSKITFIDGGITQLSSPCRAKNPIICEA